MNDILQEIINRREDTIAMAAWLILHSNDVRMVEMAERYLVEQEEVDLLMELWRAMVGEAA